MATLIEPKFKVGDIVYRITAIGIEKNKIINVWKISGGYWYDIKGAEVSEKDIFSSVDELIEYMKNNIDDMTND